MKISLTWLKEYIPVKISPEKLAAKLTMAGLEVEKIFSENGDSVFELEITPNRPDCLNYLGIAREVSAILNQSVRYPKIKTFSFPTKKPDVKIEDRQGCLRYIGILIKDVKIGESPAWLKRHLESIGSRSINNVVDITNFCLMETGQPLHAFDYDKLVGNKIIVRKAKPQESIVAIDGTTYLLDPSVLVIADEQRPVAIAGIMGGKETEVTQVTKNILLESAYFDPILIRRASRRLALTSDSSYRFERGVDRDMVLGGAKRAITLIKQLCGGTIDAKTDLVAKKEKAVKKYIQIDLDYVNDRLGGKIPKKQVQTILTRLGCQLKIAKNSFKITVPSFRNDLKSSVDIVEEIGRIIGYNNLPETFPAIKPTFLEQNPKLSFKKRLAQLLLAQGFNEIITYTMMNQNNLAKTNQAGAAFVSIKNPLSQDQGIMRPSLFPGFLNAVLSNINYGQKDLRFFELGKEYTAVGEKDVLGLVLCGNRPHDWQKAKTEFNFYDMKGAIESLLENYEAIRFVEDDSAVFQPGRAATVQMSGQDIGLFGQVAQAVLNKWDIKTKNVYLARINIDKLFEFYSSDRRYQALLEYPSVVRDISLAVKDTISFQEIVDLIQRVGIKYLTSIKFIEQYLGDKVPSGSRGMVFSLSFQSPDRTLKEEEIVGAYTKICNALTEQLGAVRR